MVLCDLAQSVDSNSHIDPTLWLAIAVLALCAVLFGLWARILLLRNKQLQRELLDAHQTALSDPLTGLLNRRAWSRFLDELASQATHRPDTAENLWMIILDIDRFKQVNDQFSHRIGDEALTEFSMRLRKAFPSAHLARIGGEEFSIILRTTRDQLTSDLARFLDEIEHHPLNLQNHAVRLSCSAGAALFPTESPPAQWFQNSDLAMYEAKRRGGNQAVIR